MEYPPVPAYYQHSRQLESDFDLFASLSSPQTGPCRGTPQSDAGDIDVNPGIAAGTPKTALKRKRLQPDTCGEGAALSTSGVTDADLSTTLPLSPPAARGGSGPRKSGRACNNMVRTLPSHFPR